MACRKTGRFPSEESAMRRVRRIWDDLAAGRATMRDHTPHAAVWCYAHSCWHLTSNAIKPKGRGKRGRLANGLRANDRRARSYR
jgi:hypothetical protein